MIKLKNILAENMRRFKTKNLNEDEDKAYNAQQDAIRLNKIADALVLKLRSMSDSDIDVKEDEQDGNTIYSIKQVRIIHSSYFKTKRSKTPTGKRTHFEHATIELSAIPTKKDDETYENADTGKIYVTVYYDKSRWSSRKFDFSIDAGVGMFSMSNDAIVNKIIDEARPAFDLN
jgi:hypothetical protein